MRKIALFLSLCVLICGCVTSSTYVKSSSRGESLYRGKCRSCHRLISRDKHSAAKWADAVERYGSKIDLSDEEKAEILRYLTGK